MDVKSELPVSDHENNENADGNHVGEDHVLTKLSSPATESFATVFEEKSQSSFQQTRKKKNKERVTSSDPRLLHSYSDREKSSSSDDGSQSGSVYDDVNRVVIKGVSPDRHPRVVEIQAKSIPDIKNECLQ